MIAVIQRTAQAAVAVAGERIAEIGPGLLALVAIEKGDGNRQVVRLADRLVGYRVFPDRDGKMNRSVTDITGQLLLVSQFTLAADTAKGMRPSFTPAAEPQVGERLFDALIEECRRRLSVQQVACGRFRADMQVSLVNDGPVTFILRSPPDTLG